MKKHTSHRPGKYPDCPLCMAMAGANENSPDGIATVRRALAHGMVRTKPVTEARTFPEPRLQKEKL